jgi:hypothetical protein
VAGKEFGIVQESDVTEFHLVDIAAGTFTRHSADKLVEALLARFVNQLDIDGIGDDVPSHAGRPQQTG